MNKPQLIRAISAKTGYTIKDISVVVDALFETVVDTVASGEEVGIQGFGKWASIERPGRPIVTPQGESIELPDMNVIKFTPGTPFKQKVRG